MRGIRSRVAARVRRLAVFVLVAIPLLWPSDAEGREVRVGIYQNQPKIFVDDEGRPAGLFVEILTAAAAVEGWVLEYVPCEWSECLRHREAGRLDLMPDVAFSRQREDVLDFHRVPVIESWSRIYSRPGRAIEVLADLDGRRVASMRDAVQHEYLEQFARGFGYRVEIVHTDSLEEAFALAARGEVDAAVANHLFGDLFHREHGLAGTPIVFQMVSLFYATARGRNHDLLEALDLRLETWREQVGSPYYAALARWAERQPPAHPSTFLLWIAMAVVVLLALSLGLAALLKLQVRARTRNLAAANEDLRRAHEILEEERRRLALVMEATNTRFDVIDADFNLRYVDDIWRKIYGDPQARKCHEYFMGRDDPCPGCGLPRAFETGQIVVTEEHLPRENRDVQVHTIPFTDAGGERLVAEFNIDITERKRAEREREAFAEQLHHSQRMEAVGRLAGGIAHDFNNLLTVINGHAGFGIKALPDGHPARTDFQRILEAGERAAGLTGRLLAFSRRQEIELGVFDINELVRGLEGMLGSLLGADIELVIELTEDPLPVEADRGQIEQAIINLAMNARDAMPDGGTLGIRTSMAVRGEEAARPREMPPGPVAAIAVSDTGHGMDEETASRAFEPFFTTKEVGKGTGLGLSMVWGIVRQSGGHVEVRSGRGEGTVFEVSLPLAGEPPPPADGPEASPAPRGRGETVLVVEDEEVVRRLMVRVLGSAGYVVLEAAGGEEALRVAEAHAGEIALLLSDMVMPGMRAPELAARLKRERPGLAVLFVTGHPGESVAADVRLLDKPFTEGALLSAAREAIDSA